VYITCAVVRLSLTIVHINIVLAVTEYDRIVDLGMGKCRLMLLRF